MESFIKQNKDPDTTLALMYHYPPAFLLLTQIAQRARRRASKLQKLKPAQAYVGDYQKMGLSEKQYRKAKKVLERDGLVAFQGTNRGTIATILNTDVYDINHERGDELSDVNGAKKGRTEGEQRATNEEGKKGKNDKKKEKGFSFREELVKLGVDEEVADDFMAVRKKKKATDTRTAFSGLKNQIDLAEQKLGMAPTDVLRECVTRDWKGFKCEWLEKEKSFAKKEKGNDRFV